MKQAMIHLSTIILALCWVSGCSEPIAPATPVDPDVLAVTTFPSFEPFLASRMSSFIFSGDTPMLASEINELTQLFDEGGSELEAWSRTVTPKGEWRVPPDEAKVLFAMLPIAISSLRGLWNRSPWNEEELDRAKGVAGYIARFPGGPRCSFVKGSAEHNTRELQRIAHWFGEQVAQPAIYGSMIFTMDDGPWPGDELAASEVLTPLSKQVVSPSLELEICRAGGESPWCLRMLREGKVAWTRRLTKVPSVQLQFTGTPPTLLGSYGWKIHMTFGEYTHAYLNPDGELLFYFTSW